MWCIYVLGLFISKCVVSAVKLSPVLRHTERNQRGDKQAQNPLAS